MGDYLERSEFNEFNRFQNLDGIEAKMVSHLVKSHTKFADIIWKLLKYNSLDALSQPTVSEAERWKMVCYDNGDPVSKRVFFSPFVDDAWQVQCSSLYIYVENVLPIDHLRSTVGITIETVTHSKISAINGDGDEFLYPLANPNDSDGKGNVVVAFKNRATVLLKCILAEFNGLYLDGAGYLQFNMKMPIKCKATMPLYNRRSYYGHSIVFACNMNNDSSGEAMGVPGEQL